MVWRRLWRTGAAVCLLAYVASTLWFLLAFGLPQCRTSELAVAARRGDVERVRRLVENGADPNVRVEIEQPESLRSRYLRLRYGGLQHDPRAAFLLQHGARSTPAFDPNLAAGWGSAAIVAQLLRAGADPRAAHLAGQSALDVAIQHRDLGTVRVLSHSGVDVNGRSKVGHTQLMEAPGVGDARLVNALIRAGPAIDQVDANGMSALHSAALGGSAESSAHCSPAARG